MNETHGPWIGHVELVLAAARLGSATQAGALLGLSTATVMRRLASVEEHLGVRLFDRTPSGLSPTSALALVLPWAEKIEAAGTSLVREVAGLESTPSGSVRISLLEPISTWIVAPALPALFARYPELELTLLPGADLVDLVKGEADIVLRTVRPKAGDLVAKQLAEFQMVVAASPELLAERRPKTLSDLPWIDWDASAPQTPDVTWLQRNVPDARVVLRSNSIGTMMHAARAGAGATLLATPLVAAMGGLSRVTLPSSPPLPTVPLYMVVHSAQRSIPRIAVVWEFLVETFEKALATASYRLA